MKFRVVMVSGQAHLEEKQEAGAGKILFSLRKAMEF